MKEGFEKSNQILFFRSPRAQKNRIVRSIYQRMSRNTVREMLTQFSNFVVKWKLYFQQLDENSKPKCGSATLLLSKYDDMTDDLKSFIAIYLCRNKTRRNWFENECGIIFLQNSQQRQLLLQFEPKGSKKESIIDISHFSEGIFTLDTPWEDEIGKDKKSCLICLESVSSRVVRGDICVCDHIFCLECISRWSTIQNKCPACKRIFTEIRTHEKIPSNSSNSSKKRKLERIFPVSPDSHSQSILDSPPSSPSSPSSSADPPINSADYWYRFVSNEVVMADFLFRLFGEESVQLNHELYRPMFYRHILTHFGIVPDTSRSLELFHRDSSLERDVGEGTEGGGGREEEELRGGEEGGVVENSGE